MAKPLDMLTAAEIKRAYDKAAEADSIATRALVNAGRGNELCSDTRAKSDPLSLDYIRTADAFNAIVAEMAARKWYHGGLNRIIRRGA